MANGPKLGYDDLNKLVETPSDLVFRIGLLSITKLIMQCAP